VRAADSTARPSTASTTASTWPPTSFGTDEKDTIVGGDGVDTIDGGASNDSLAVKAGNDSIVGGAGSDTLNDSTGTDRFSGGADRDVLLAYATRTVALNFFLDNVDNDGASSENDHVTNDIESIFGGTGNDTISIPGTDTLGRYLNGGAGHDLLIGGGGPDSLYGADGNDILNSNSGDDQLFGGAGRDVKIAGGGTDALDGGTGEDILIGGGYVNAGNNSTLSAIRTEWTRTDRTYAQRVASLSNGTGEVSKLNATTVGSSPIPPTVSPEARTRTGSSSTPNARTALVTSSPTS